MSVGMYVGMHGCIFQKRGGWADYGLEGLGSGVLCDASLSGWPLVLLLLLMTSN